MQLFIRLLSILGLGINCGLLMASETEILDPHRLLYEKVSTNSLLSGQVGYSEVADLPIEARLKANQIWPGNIVNGKLMCPLSSTHFKSINRGFQCSTENEKGEVLEVIDVQISFKDARPIISYVSLSMKNVCKNTNRFIKITKDIRFDRNQVHNAASKGSLILNSAILTSDGLRGELSCKSSSDVEEFSFEVYSGRSAQGEENLMFSSVEEPFFKSGPLSWFEGISKSQVYYLDSLNHCEKNFGPDAFLALSLDAKGKDKILYEKLRIVFNGERRIAFAKEIPDVVV